MFHLCKGHDVGVLKIRLKAVSKIYYGRHSAFHTHKLISFDVPVAEVEFPFYGVKTIEFLRKFN